MKKLLLVLLSLFAFVSNSNAEVLKTGSLYCVSSKKIISYYRYLESGNSDYAQRFLDDSDCFIKRKDQHVVVSFEQKKYTEVELLSGFKVWTKNENITK